MAEKRSSHAVKTLGEPPSLGIGRGEASEPSTPPPMGAPTDTGGPETIEPWSESAFTAAPTMASEESKPSVASPMDAPTAPGGPETIEPWSESAFTAAPTMVGEESQPSMGVPTSAGGAETIEPWRESAFTAAPPMASSIQFTLFAAAPPDSIPAVVAGKVEQVEASLGPGEIVAAMPTWSAPVGVTGNRLMTEPSLLSDADISTMSGPGIGGPSFVPTR